METPSLIIDESSPDEVLCLTPKVASEVEIQSASCEPEILPQQVHPFNIDDNDYLDDPDQILNNTFQTSLLTPLNVSTLIPSDAQTSFDMNFDSVNDKPPFQVDVIGLTSTLPSTKGATSPDPQLPDSHKVTEVQKRKNESPLSNGKSKLPCQGLALLRISHLKDFQLGPSPLINQSQTLQENLNNILKDIHTGKVMCTQKPALKSMAIHLHDSWPDLFPDLDFASPSSIQSLDVSVYCYVLFVAQHLQHLNKKVTELKTDLVASKSQASLSTYEKTLLEAQAKEIARLRSQCSALTEKYSLNTTFISTSFDKQKENMQKQLLLKENTIKDFNTQITLITEANTKLQKSIIELAAAPARFGVDKETQSESVVTHSDEMTDFINTQSDKLEKMEKVMAESDKSDEKKKDHTSLKLNERTQVQLESSNIALDQAKAEISRLQLQLMSDRADHSDSLSKLCVENKGLKDNLGRSVRRSLKKTKRKPKSSSSSSSDSDSQTNSNKMEESSEEELKPEPIKLKLTKGDQTTAPTTAATNKGSPLTTPSPQLQPEQDKSFSNTDEPKRNWASDRSSQSPENLSSASASQKNVNLKKNDSSNQMANKLSSEAPTSANPQHKSNVTTHLSTAGGIQPIAGERLAPFSATNKVKSFEDDEEKADVDFLIKEEEKTLDDTDDRERSKPGDRSDSRNSYSSKLTPGYSYQRGSRSHSRPQAANASYRDVQESVKARLGDKRADSRVRRDPSTHYRNQAEHSGRFKHEKSEFHDDYCKIRTMTNKVKSLITSDPRLMDILKNEVKPEEEVWQLLNAKFLKNLAQCETTNDFEKFLKTKKGPSRKDTSWSQWPDFSSNSKEWKFVVINDHSRPYKGSKTPPLVNFDCLITLMRVYNKDFYTMFVQLLRSAQPGGVHYTDLLFPKVFELETEEPRSLYEKKVDLLQLLLVSRLHFSMKRKLNPISRNRKNLFHYNSQPFTEDWAKEVGDSGEFDALILNEQTINALYVDTKRCALALNQFRSDKTRSNSVHEELDESRGGSFMDNSD